jgi:hypothetical protein
MLLSQSSAASTTPWALHSARSAKMQLRKCRGSGESAPVTRSVRADSVFPADACSYGRTKFGALQVQVWDDAAAPAVVSDYVFQPKHLHQALLALDGTLPHNCWLAGERGTGKTEFVTQLAARSAAPLSARQLRRGAGAGGLHRW